MPRLVESRTIEPIPAGERYGKVWHLWPVWFAGNAQLATLATGTVGAAGRLGLGWSALAILLGCALGTVFMALHAAQGPVLGLPQMIQSRAQFGARGAILVYAVALITYIGFTVLNLLLAADSFPLLLHAARAPMLGLFIALACLLAVLGYRAIHWAQRTVSLLVLATLALFTILSARLSLPAATQTGHFLIVPFLTQFFASAAYQLTWAIYVSDYSRYLARDTGIAASFAWTYCGSLIGGVWMMLAGLIAYSAFPRLGLPAALLASGNAVLPHLGAPLLASGLLALVSASAVNLYGGMLTGLSLFAGFAKPARSTGRRIAIIAAMGALTLGLALHAHGRLVDQVSDLLFALLYLFTPWTAINLADFYWLRHGQYAIAELIRPDGLYGKWNWRGLAAYALGFFVMVPFFSTGLYEGPAAQILGGADLSMLIGLPVAAGAYVFFNRRAERNTRPGPGPFSAAHKEAEP